MDKKAVDLILVRPTRTGVEKLGKEIMRLRGIAETRATEMQMWKDAVTARNKTIENLNADLDGRKAELVRVYRELQESANIVSEEKKQDAVKVERLRTHILAAHITVSEISDRLVGISAAIVGINAATRSVRDSIAGEQKIDYAKELIRETDNAAK